MRHLALAIALLLAVAPVRAELPPDAMPRLSAAMTRIDALTRDARAHGALPRLSDPQARGPLEAMWDAPSILGQPPYAAAAIPVLIDVMEVENRLYKTYALFSADPATLPDTAANATVYQDEMSRSLAFSLHVMAAVFPAIADFVRSLPPAQFTEIRQQGLSTVRLGMLETITGAVLSIRSPALRPDNALRLSQALAYAAGPIAAGLTLADRETLAATAGGAVPAAAATARPPLARFVAAMRSTECTGLCRVP